MNPSLPRAKVVPRSSINQKPEKGPPNSPSQVSKITSYPATNPTRTRAISSLVSKSTHPSSIRNAVSTKGVAGNYKAAKLKNQIVPPKVEATKGRVILVD